MNKSNTTHQPPALLVSQFCDKGSSKSERSIWSLSKSDGSIRIKSVGKDGTKVGQLSISDDQVVKAISEMSQKHDSVYSVDAWSKVAAYVASLFKTETQEEQLKVNAAVLRARWAIITMDNAQLILNDRGMAAMHNPNWNAYGYVFPLRPDVGLMLGRGPFNKPVIWLDGSWHIIIPELRLKASLVKSLNAAACQQAENEAYGSSSNLLESLAKHIGKSPAQDSVDVFENASLLGLSVKKRKEDAELMEQLLHGLDEPLDANRIPMSMRI